MGFGPGRGRFPFPTLPTWPFPSQPTSSRDAVPVAAAQPACAAPSQTPCTPNPAKREAQLIDGFYSLLPPAEVMPFYREGRVMFASSARFDGSGDIVEFSVPAGQALVVSSLDFYADPQDGASPAFGEGALRGYLAFALFFNGRAPLDMYSEITVPSSGPDPFGVMSGSFFSGTGRALGRAGDSPCALLRAPEGTAVRASYAVLRQPPVTVGHVGAVLRGFLVPSAVLDKKA